MSKVFVVTVSYRQDSGEFSTSTHGVWLEKKAARENLNLLTKKINAQSSPYVERRMCQPIGQADDWTIDILENGFWNCSQFFELREQELRLNP